MYKTYGIMTPEYNAAPLLWRATRALEGTRKTIRTHRFNNLTENCLILFSDIVYIEQESRSYSVADFDTSFFNVTCSQAAQVLRPRTPQIRQRPSGSCTGVSRDHRIETCLRVRREEPVRQHARTGQIGVLMGAGSH